MDNQYSSFYLYRKYEVIGDELVDLGITSIDAEGTMPTVMKEECDPACGCIEPQYRWVVVSGGYECSGTTKMTQEKEQVSLDSGVTWSDVSPLTTRATLPVIEQYSQDCGYVPLTRWVQTEDTVCIEKFGGKFKLTLNDGTVITKDCDATSAVSKSEVSSQYSGSVVSAEIGDCVTSIGIWAFYNCRSLTSYTLGDNVRIISNYAFTNCSGLTSINIPDSVTTLGWSVFSSCSSLTSITIPNSVTSIGPYVFYRCTSLTSITIPDSVTSIGHAVFEECSGLTSVTIGTGITNISEALFNCTSLTSVTIPNSVTTIGQQAFDYCSGLTSVDIPNSVTSIGVYAFGYCTSLTSVAIGNNVTSIGNYAFYRSSGLTVVRILATTPPTLGTDVFRYTNDCPIYVPAESVNAYKAASGWSNYASRIRAIS